MWPQSFLFQSPQCGIRLCDGGLLRQDTTRVRVLSIPSMWDYSLRPAPSHRSATASINLSIPSMWDYSLRRTGVTLPTSRMVPFNPLNVGLLSATWSKWHYKALTKYALSIPSMWDYSLRRYRTHVPHPQPPDLSIPSMWDYSLRHVANLEL